MPQAEEGQDEVTHIVGLNLEVLEGGRDEDEQVDADFGRADEETLENGRARQEAVHQGWNSAGREPAELVDALSRSHSRQLPYGHHQN